MINRVYIRGISFVSFTMFDPEELNAKIARSHINAEKVEAEAQGLESKLLENYEF